jgi:phospholipid-binding lipoprotein MlaA
MNLERHDEDFGQTLAVWGVPSGPYLVLPLLGPSTLRDTVGRVPDYLARPTRNIDINGEVDTTLTSMEIIHKRESLLHLDDTLSQAYDPYGLVRDSWLQRREFVVFDGNPPITEPEELDSDE